MKKVVIIGGGYAGIKVLLELVKYEDLELILLDKHSYHNLQPEVYDYIANKKDSADMTIDLITLCKGLGDRVKFFNKRVVDIDFAAQKVIADDKDEFSYDYLAITIGARTFFPKVIEGLNNTQDMKKLHKALSFKQKFEFELFKKMDNEARKCEDMHIAIIGAGLSGVEIAAEMAYYANYFFKKGYFACDYMKIYLVEGSNAILPGMDKYIVEKATERLKDLNVDILTGRFVSKIDEKNIYLSDETLISYSFSIFTGGIEASNLSNSLKLEKNRRGHIVVDSFGRVKNFENVFGAGDVIEAKDETGAIMPATVETARQTGIAIAQNIRNTIDNKPLVKYKTTSPGVLVALGGNYAVGVLNVGKNFSIKISGLLAYIVKHFVFFIYRKPLQNISKLGYKRFCKEIKDKRCRL